MPSISLTLPVSGNVITAALHSGNYSALLSLLNGGLDDANISSVSYSKINVPSSAITNAKLAGYPWVNADISATAAIAPSKLAGYPTDATKALFGDSTWKVPGGIAPTHLAGMGSPGAVLIVTANTAYLMPIADVTVPTTLTRICWAAETIVAGNYDVGIYYSDDEATFTQLVSKGSTAQPAAGNLISTIPSTTITPVAGRRWYYAIALSTGSSLEACGRAATTGGGIPGYTKAASFPLPASLTGVSAVGSVPLPVLHGAI